MMVESRVWFPDRVECQQSIRKSRDTVSLLCVMLRVFVDDLSSENDQKYMSAQCCDDMD